LFPSTQTTFGGDGEGGDDSLLNGVNGTSH